MSDATGIDDASLTVLLDVRHPACYLALDAAMPFARELGIEINWLPLTVPPLRPPSEPTPDDDRSVVHRRHRARAIEREIEVYGRARGLVLREPHRDGDCGPFVLGWLFIREHHHDLILPYLRTCFERYWAVDLDVADIDAIASVLAAIGAPTSDFGAWCDHEGPEQAAGLADELRDRGIFAAPGYVVEGEFFQGRQHLAMIRWILGGREGKGPI